MIIFAISCTQHTIVGHNVVTKRKINENNTNNKKTIVKEEQKSLPDENTINKIQNQSQTITTNTQTTSDTTTSTSKKQISTLPVDKWNELRTSQIPGIYKRYNKCTKCSMEKVDYYFYNVITEKMVGIPESDNFKWGARLIPIPDSKYYSYKNIPIYDTPIYSTKDLGDLEDEFMKYGNKSNKYTYNGKTYTVKEPEPLHPERLPRKSTNTEPEPLSAEEKLYIINESNKRDDSIPYSEEEQRNRMKKMLQECE